MLGVYQSVRKNVEAGEHKFPCIQLVILHKLGFHRSKHSNKLHEYILLDIMSAI